MKPLSGLILFLTAAFMSCTDESGIKGTLTISLTDSPADADNVKSVNLFITNVDALQGGARKSLHHFDQASGINLLEYSGGTSLVLIDQFLDPGKFTELRLTLNLADLNSSLIRSPQCNVEFTDGTTKPIYFFDSGTADIVVAQEFAVTSRGHTDITRDFDVRKSLIRDDQGNYILKPVIRMVETAKAGHITATVTNHNSADRIVVFAYPSGQFSLAETATPAAGDIRFKNSITSAKLTNTKFGLGFLVAGSYDLVFVRNSETGEFLSVLGRENGVTVTTGETQQVSIDLNKLTGS